MTKVHKPYSIKDIVAAPAKPPIADGTICVICEKKLTDERLQALSLIGVTNPRRVTCINCCQTKKILGQYLGEAGTSEMLLVDHIEENSVRGMFRKQASDDGDDDDEEDEKDKD
jgi:hypothetical protein